MRKTVLMSGLSEKIQTVKVVILGEEYPIRGSAEPEFILRVAEYVDRKMRDIASKSKNRSPEKLAVLAALNIAGELLELEAQRSDKISSVENRAKTILELLESKLPVGDAD